MKHSSLREQQNAIPVLSVPAEEQTRRIEAAIAQRAYEIFEKRGGMGWHELEDWRTAESQIQRPACVGITSRDHSLIIDIDIASLEPGTLEIWAAPRQITISGKHHTHRHSAIPENAAQTNRTTYRAIELNTAIAHDRATTHLHGANLEICLPVLEEAQVLKRSAAGAA